MRATKDTARETRERIMVIAAMLFREHGFDRVGVAQLMEPAGFTHGGFHVEFCNSRKPSDARGRSCPAAALEGEAVRRSVETRSATSGIEHLLKAIAGVM